MPQKDRIIRLCDAAPKEHKQDEFFSIDPSTYPTILANRDGKGIYSVYFTVVHEKYHLYIYDTFKSFINTGSDSDDDWIRNQDESAGWGDVKTFWLNSDTYKIGEYLELDDKHEFGDQEIRCMRAVYNLTGEDINKNVFPEKDWANPGCQSKELWGRPPETTP